MSIENDLVNQGIAAYEAGDKRQAQRLLSQAVKADKTNEQAWYYLALSLNDPERRRQCLHQVLKLNRDHAGARRELAKLADQLEAEPQQVADVDTADESITEPRPDLRAEVRESRPPAAVNLPLLAAIPGAPVPVTVADITGFIGELARDMLAVFTRRINPIQKQATWWRFWLTVTSVSLAIGILYVIRALVVDIRFQTAPNFLAIITVPLLTLLTGSVAVAAGCYLSHWYATKQENGSASLLDHSYSLALIWAPAAILMGILAVLEVILRGVVLTLRSVLLSGFVNLTIPSLLLTLVALLITVYTLYLMKNALAALHQISDRALWITAIIMLTVTALIF